ncbi:MAG: hypothetical protein ABIJ00_12235, partial [Candidatus Eisenbacteria bacterium]
MQENYYIRAALAEKSDAEILLAVSLYWTDYTPEGQEILMDVFVSKGLDEQEVAEIRKRFASNAF